MKKRILLLFFFMFCFVNVNAKTFTQTEYEALGIKRAYVVCDYVFDINKHNPTLSDLLLSSQSCPTDKVTIVEIKISQDLNGNTTRVYQELLTGTKYNSFPSINVKYIYSSAIGANEQKNTVDTTPSTVTHELQTKTITQTEYEKLNVARSYIVGAYVFDINKQNPTLRDLMLASQTNKKGSISIYEVKVSKNLDGVEVKTYQNVLTGSKLSSFPTFDGRYLMESSINPSDHTKETRTDLLTGQRITGADSSQPQNSDPRNKEVNYSTRCMGYLRIPKIKLGYTDGIKDVKEANRPYGICIRWKDRSKNPNAEYQDPNANNGLYTLPVSNYPNVPNGNLVIAGHSGTADISYFKTLYKLAVGDKASVTFNGNTYNYVIKNIYNVPKTGVVKITRNSARSTLTLITCAKTASGQNDEAHQTVYILELTDIDGKEYH